MNTTGLSKAFAFQPMCHGLYLDIFPLDHWDEKDTESYARIDRLNRGNSAYMRLKNPYLDEKNRARVSAYSGWNHIKAYEEIQSIARQYNGKETKYLVRAVRTAYDFSHYRFYSEDYSRVIPGVFEGFQFPIPAGYQRILTIQFGDYMTFPPPEKRGAWHGDLVFDADKPYPLFLQSYQEQLSKGD